ncbi:hypothetical protein YPPY98_0395, partial [Yersinia pestis PY-98]
MACRADPEVA